MGLKGLSGKCAVVTGAGQGIGRGICERLLDEGCRVVGVDRNADALSSWASSIAPEKMICVIADASREEDCDRYFKSAIMAFEHVDLMVNNVGILGHFANIADLTVADFETMFAVNVRSVFLGLRGAIRLMSHQGGGSIVNISSMAALRAAPGRAFYGATKRAVVGLSQSAAVENGRTNIRVNTILPGAVDTPMSDIVDQNRVKMGGRMSIENYPMARKGDPSEIAAMAAWLLSDDASYATGGVYTIDGGASA